MKRLALALALALLLLAPTARAQQTLEQVLTRADAAWDSILVQVQAGQEVWTASHPYPVQCLDSHATKPSHDDTRNDDRAPDRLDTRPEHRRDMVSCQDDLGLDAGGRGNPLPHGWTLHTHRCFTRSGTCDFVAWTLYGEFDYDLDGAGGQRPFTYRRARTELERNRAGTPEDHGTRGEWIEYDFTGEPTGLTLRERVAQRGR